MTQEPPSALTCTGHEPQWCNVPGCPGAAIQRKLEVVDGVLAALDKIANHPEGIYSRDRETYLENIIAWCQDMAHAAIARATVPQEQGKP